jgi:hypothetical protein
MRRNIEVVALGWPLDGKTIGCEAGLIEITVRVTHMALLARLHLHVCFASPASGKPKS